MTISLDICVGSTNAGKLLATHLFVSHHPWFSTSANILSAPVPSGVSPQPTSLEEIKLGAKNRSARALNHSNAWCGVGLESGIFRTSHGEWMDTTCACIHFDNDLVLYGMSSCFVVPKAIVDMVLDKGLELTDAALACGFACNREAGGLIGTLSNGRVTRVDLFVQALEMAAVGVR